MSIQARGSSCGHPGALLGRRVLVVEDEALVAMLVEDELRDAGAEVLTAATLADALRLVADAARDGGLDAAILDMSLRGEAVLPVADVLADLGVPFLFATGYGEGCDRGRHKAAPTLGKPFDLDDLIALVRSLAARASPRRAASG